MSPDVGYQGLTRVGGTLPGFSQEDTHLPTTLDAAFGFTKGDVGGAGIAAANTIIPTVVSDCIAAGASNRVASDTVDLGAGIGGLNYTNDECCIAEHVGFPLIAVCALWLLSGDLMPPELL
jgi:hypothetical protein